MDVKVFNRYPLRRCLSMHKCIVCGYNISYSQMYYDGGDYLRAHQSCVDKTAEQGEPKTQSGSAPPTGNKSEPSDITAFCNDRDCEFFKKNCKECSERYINQVTAR